MRVSLLFMQESLPRLTKRFRGFKRTILAIMAVFVVGLALLSQYVFQLETKLVRQMTLSNAKLHATALSEFRTLYTSEVVERARMRGVRVTHDYEKEEGAIPLPATLSLLLGNRLDAKSDISVRLYSDYPFPWREPEGGARDDFEQDALNFLRKDPTGNLVRYQEVHDQTVLRYAVADRMRASCVNCHNSHPESPKTDWKVGDVRGVLAITLPLDQDSEQARAALRGMLMLLLGAATLALLLLGFISMRLRTSALEAERLAQSTRDINKSLEREIDERERAEGERRQMEAQVRHTQKLETVGLLAGGIAHDFNNLLQSVLGNTKLALELLPAESNARDHVSRIELAANKAAGLTDQLLTYAGKSPRHKEMVGLTELVSEMKPLLETSSSKTVTVHFELEDNLPWVEADPSQLQQVVMNLVTNACDAVATQGGEVWVRTKRGRPGSDVVNEASSSMDPVCTDYAILEVQDTGTGMDVETRERIFDPFFTTKGTGRGLGLASLSGIMKSHRGALCLQTAPNEGTNIQAYFPAHEGKPLEVRTQPETFAVPAELPMKTVLVIDDDEEVRGVTAELLELGGLKVVQLPGGEEAAKALKTHGPFDAVVSDMLMPGMSGEDTFHALRNIQPDLRIILSTGYAGHTSVDDLLAHDNVWLLKKPYTHEELMGVILEALNLGSAPSPTSLME